MMIIKSESFVRQFYYLFRGNTAYKLRFPIICENWQ